MIELISAAKIQVFLYIKAFYKKKVDFTRLAKQNYLWYIGTLVLLKSRGMPRGGGGSPIERGGGSDA